MCEVEFIVNGRFLIKVFDDSRDLEVFISNYFFLLRLGFILSFGVFRKEDVYFRRRWR